jgi:phage-related tail fiber protein
MPETNQEFYSLLTERGLEKQADSIIDGAPIRLTHIALGDVDYSPAGYETHLQNEVYRTALTRVALDTTDPNKIIAEAIISGDAGGFWIREVGIFDGDGELFALGRYPATYKPILTNGAVKDLCVRMVLKFSNASNVSLIYNSGMGGSGTTAGTFLSYTDYGHIIEAVPFSTEAKPNFEYDFASGDYNYDYGTLQD